jgi:lipoprotein NlpD
MVMTKNRSMNEDCAPLSRPRLLLAGCARREPARRSRTAGRRAPHGASRRVPPPVDPAAEPPKPGAENAGKRGYYTVKPGDTLIRIGLENGQNWKDLVKWNNLDNPNVIEVGPGAARRAAGRRSERGRDASR